LINLRVTIVMKLLWTCSLELDRSVKWLDRSRIRCGLFDRALHVRIHGGKYRAGHVGARCADSAKGTRSDRERVFHGPRPVWALLRSCHARRNLWLCVSVWKMLRKPRDIRRGHGHMGHRSVCVCLDRCARTHKKTWTKEINVEKFVPHFVLSGWGATSALFAVSDSRA
jgi:hypothetical protein